MKICIYVEIFYCCGIAKFDLKDREGAIKCYDKAIELDSHHVMAYFTRGLSKEKLSFNKNAIKDYDKAIELENFARTYLRRGLLKQLLKDKDGARIDLTKVGELGITGTYEFIINYC